MSRLAVVCLALSGCIIADPINQRPSLDIKQTSGEVVYRGDMVELEAVAEDPEQHFVFFHFRAYLGTAGCATDISQCDSEPFAEMSSDHFEFQVESFRKPPNDTVPVELVRVVLQGQDDYGATANPPQELLIPIADRPPTLRLFKSSPFDDVVQTPVHIYAEVGDPDDGPANPTLTWEVFTPTNQPNYTFVDVQVEPDTDETTVEYGKQLTSLPRLPDADGTGDYMIRVTATDSLGQQTTETIPIVIGPDTPPCLRQLSPLVAVSPASLPMSAPTLFQVHVVKDELDPYPMVNDPFGIVRATRFTWSLSRNGGPRQALTGVSGNSVALDPAAYQTDDILELRVEIYDRNNTAITCADGIATCSVISDNTCLQRQTWRVEVR